MVVLLKGPEGGVFFTREVPLWRGAGCGKERDSRFVSESEGE